MRFEGVISRWNDDRGFGFIKPYGSDDTEIFVHISEFPKDGQRPTVGERVSFSVITGKNGKKQAKNLFCPEKAKAKYEGPEEKPSSPQRKQARANKSPSGLVGLLLIVALVSIAAVIFQQAKKEWSAIQHRRELSQMQSDKSAGSARASSRFRCDGRTHCSQMTSCEEAKFFLKNCPGTKMDGDNDGIPCEQQLCSW